MFTRKALNKYINGFIEELKSQGYKPMKAILFGSYAYGKPNELSDIDLALWDARFKGCGTHDVEPIATLLSKYPFIELHPFAPEDTPEQNPFVHEITKKGHLITIP